VGLAVGLSGADAPVACAQHIVPRANAKANPASIVAFEAFRTILMT
jgi:hypothetical protein